ncbi:MAG: lytic transglycosylase domain-containing protein [Acidiferrobacterales bacterium]
MLPVTTNCVSYAAQAYGVPLAAVVGVLRAEGGKVGMARKDPDGTTDYGPMQINSVWLPTLSRAGITASLLRYDGCLNIAVGAWILRWQIASHHGSVWAGIGAYHSDKPSLARQYEFNVYRALNRVRNFTEAVDAANP